MGKRCFVILGEWDWKTLHAMYIVGLSEAVIRMYSIT